MNEIVITWWMGLMMASAAFMFAIVVMHKLHEWGICPFRAITNFVRRPWFERLLLLFVICGMVQYGATKGTGGGSRSADDDARKNVPECVSQTQDPSRDGIPEQSGEITALRQHLRTCACGRFIPMSCITGGITIVTTEDSRRCRIAS